MPLELLGSDIERINHTEDPMTNIPRSLARWAFIIGIAVAAPACAAQTYAYRPDGVNREVQRRAYDNGYREGSDQGRKDARDRRDFSFERHGDYRDADDGYRRSDGNKDSYRQFFREGFRAGYSQAFNQTAAYRPGPSERGSSDGYRGR
jgi:hypothetical protein